jgi:glycosyltransferase involved in cell wall biosynthesis
VSKLISVVSPCYNEEQNVELLYDRIKAVFAQLPQYRYELIFIDNASTDNTVAVLKRIAAQDRRVKIIVNMRNFGHARSGFHGVIQANGDAVVYLVADLQEPPELIPEFLKHWEAGQLLVVGVKTKSAENPMMYTLRTLYYRLLNAVSDVELIEHYANFGLYDKRVISELRKVADPAPYIRGLVAELGFSITEVPFVQPKRKFGKTKYGFYAYYDLAMQGLTSHSLLPLRIATFLGAAVAAGCAFATVFCLVYQTVHWKTYVLGVIPAIIGMFAILATQLIFIGLMGEYIGATYRHLLARPRVVERERINFDDVLDGTKTDLQPSPVSPEVS